MPFPKGGCLPQIKTDAIGFQIISPQDLPHVYEQKETSLDEVLEEVSTENLTDSNSQEHSASDSLLAFLEKRKKQRKATISERYSRKGIGLRAYHIQIKSLQGGTEKEEGFFINQDD